MWKTLWLAGLLLAGTGCAARQERREQRLMAVDAYSVLLVNASTQPLKYKYTEFRIQQRPEGGAAAHDFSGYSIALADPVDFLELTPGQQIILRVVPNSELVLRTGPTSPEEKRIIERTQRLSFNGQSLESADWQAPF